MCSKDGSPAPAPVYVEGKPKCRKAGERCAGAEGMPGVEWIDCCEGGCDAEHPDWGMICAKGGYVEEQPKCRKAGERCAGAEGKPAVEWIDCCEGGCVAEHLEWGMMCVEEGYVVTEPPLVIYTTAPDVEPATTKAYTTKVEPTTKTAKSTATNCVAAAGEMCGNGYEACCDHTPPTQSSIYLVVISAESTTVKCGRGLDYLLQLKRSNH